MYRMVTIPLLVLFLVLFYFFFEVPIMKMVAWFSGDGMMNYFAISRLEDDEELGAIDELTRGQYAKTRYFAIQAADRHDREQGLKALPALVKDPDWEVRMTAVAIAGRRGWKPAGAAMIDRILSKDSMGEGKRRYQFEREALLAALPSCAAPANAESMARLAITTEDRPAAVAARKGLWPLGPLPQAELAYIEILNDPGRHAAKPEDKMAALHAAAVLDLPGALGHLIQSARKEASEVQLEAVRSLGFLGGEGAKKFLETLTKTDPWRKLTGFEEAKRKAAERALERIRRKEQGLPDMEPEVPAATPEAGATPTEEPASVDDLLDAYGSDAEDEPPPPPKGGEGS